MCSDAPNRQEVPIGSYVARSQYGLNSVSTRDGNIPIIGMKDMAAGKITADAWARTHVDESQLPEYLLQKGDILLNRTNSADLVGKVSLWDREEEAVFASYLVRFQFDPAHALPNFVNHYLNWDDSQQRLKQISTRGVSQANINPTTFRNHFMVSWPPLLEQRRVAAILDQWDNAIATVEKLVQSRQRRKGGLIKSIFFGAANWFDASISELADVVGGGTPSTNKRAYWDGDIPWCTPTDITGLDTRYIEATERTISETGLAASNASLLPVGSIILCSRASVGECAINLVPMATNQGFQSLVPKGQNDRYFLYYLVQAYKPELIRLSAGSTFMEFPKSALRTMNIRIPEAEKRQEVGLLFNDVDDELDQTVALLKRLRLQKRGLMQKLLNGDWPVPASIDRLLPGGRDIDEAVGAEVQRAEATG